MFPGLPVFEIPRLGNVQLRVWAAVFEHEGDPAQEENGNCLLARNLYPVHGSLTTSIIGDVPHLGVFVSQARSRSHEGTRQCCHVLFSQTVRVEKVKRHVGCDPDSFYVSHRRLPFLSLIAQSGTRFPVYPQNRQDVATLPLQLKRICVSEPVNHQHLFTFRASRQASRGARSTHVPSKPSVLRLPYPPDPEDVIAEAVTFAPADSLVKPVILPAAQVVLDLPFHCHRYLLPSSSECSIGHTMSRVPSEPSERGRVVRQLPLVGAQLPLDESVERDTGIRVVGENVSVTEVFCE